MNSTNNFKNSNKEHNKSEKKTNLKKTYYVL